MSGAGWLRVLDGAGPVVLFAPHGGRRSRDSRRGDGVNDLHTAEMTAELAQRLGCRAIINEGLDRNVVDLNRISELAAAAPEVLASLRESVDQVLASGRVPLVVFVHGWNMVVPCCDLGVGLRTRGGVLTGSYPTLARGSFERLRSGLGRNLTDRSLSIGIGRRYPAGGKDNAAQLFSGRHEGHECEDVAYLSGLAAAGKAEAAQIELGIPLRWPGPQRDALLDALAKTLADFEAGAVDDAAPRSAEWSLPPTRKVDESGLDSGYAVQSVLGDGTGLFAGVEPTSPHGLASRFCLVRPGGEMLLLVGEGDWDGDKRRYELEGLRWEISEDGALTAELDGSLIAYPTHEAYLDLEAGLADSRLVQGRGRLRLEPGEGGFGRLTGHIAVGSYEAAVDSYEIEIDSGAFLERSGRRGQGGVNDGGVNRVRLFITEGECAGTRLYAATQDLPIKASDDAPLGGFTIEDDSQPIRAGRVEARVPVWRDGPGGSRVRWTFGMVRYRVEEAGGERWVRGGFDSLELFND